jgi:hypothetical protein
VQWLKDKEEGSRAEVARVERMMNAELTKCKADM